MRNAMRLLVVILILGIVMTNVAYASTGLEMNSAQANRKMILRVPVGDNEGEIGYTGLRIWYIFVRNSIKWIF